MNRLTSPAADSRRTSMLEATSMLPARAFRWTPLGAFILRERVGDSSLKDDIIIHPNDLAALVWANRLFWLHFFFPSINITYTLIPSSLPALSVNIKESRDGWRLTSDLWRAQISAGGPPLSAGTELLQDLREKRSNMKVCELDPTDGWAHHRVEVHHLWTRIRLETHGVDAETEETLSPFPSFITVLLSQNRRSVCEGHSTGD